MVTATGVYPEYLEQIERLVERHLENFNETLELVVYYAPEHDTTDVFLFELLTDFESGSLEEQGDILEVLYGATPAFPMPDMKGNLHIILTSPAELHEAKRKNTRLYQELKTAYTQGKTWEIYTGDYSLEEVLK